MALAQNAVQVETPLYERDFCRWIDEQVRLLKDDRLEQLDVINLIAEIEDLGIHEKKAVQSDLVVVLKHLLKYQFQPRRRSRSWLSSIAEHRRRLRNISRPAQAYAPMPVSSSRHVIGTAGIRP